MVNLFAYLDAGTGSLILQAIMGGIAGFTVLSRFAWQSLRHRFVAQRHDELTSA